MSISDHRAFEGTHRFSIERCLGAGAFGFVYEAFDRERNTRLALKRLRQTDAAALYRFKREFRALADLTHPNLVALYELLSDGEQWFFTMELLDGVSFLDYFREDMHVGSDLDSSSSPAISAHDIDSRLRTMEAPASRPRYAESQDGEVPPGLPLGPYALARLRGVLRQLAEGLSALHEAGILHCDIKPSNVLVTGEGRVVLLDFGLVAELSPLEPKQSTHIVGTPAYMSPEQGAGLRTSEASDWYSVGVMLFEALTGRLPFPATLEAFRDKQKTEAQAPSKLVPEVPGDLDALCRDLLRRDPSKRPHGREILRRLGTASVVVSKPTSAVSTAKLPAPFVGRETHLTSLHRAYQEMKRGRAVSVYVHGSSGMGKTALVRQFLERLQQIEKDAVVLTGRCYERESVPYKALDSLVDHLSVYLKHLPISAAAALLPRNVPALARVFPVLQRVEAVARARRRLLEIPDSQELRRRAFAGLRELLGRLSDRKPLVLFIDDMQWGDVDSAALLAELLRPPDPPALLLTGCYRSEEATTSPLLRKLLPLRGTSGWTPHIYELLVGELAPGEARDLALNLLGEEQPASAARAEAIARESAGSPFFINELVQYTQAGGGLAERGDQAQLPVDPETTEATLDDVIQTRVSRLPEEARRLLSVIAVAGRPLEVSLAKRA
ncbi:MAG: serine/threonine-protein kinase PknK, partial [Acidobacteriota bacterium]